MIEYIILGIAGIAAIISSNFLLLRRLDMSLKDSQEPRNRRKRQLKDVIDERIASIDVANLLKRMEAVEHRWGLNEEEEEAEQGEQNELFSFWHGLPGIAKNYVNSFVKGKLGFSVDDALADASKLPQLMELIGKFMPQLVPTGGGQAAAGGQGQRQLTQQERSSTVDLTPMDLTAKR